MSGSESEELSVSVEELEAKQAKLHDIRQAKVPTGLTLNLALST